MTSKSSDSRKTVGPALVNDDPACLDWGRAELEAPVIDAIVTAIHPQTARGRTTAMLRQSALAAPSWCPDQAAYFVGTT